MIFQIFWLKTIDFYPHWAHWEAHRRKWQHIRTHIMHWQQVLPSLGQWFSTLSTLYLEFKNHKRCHHESQHKNEVCWRMLIHLHYTPKNAPLQWIMHIYKSKWVLKAHYTFLEWCRSKCVLACFGKFFANKDELRRAWIPVRSHLSEPIRKMSPVLD